MKSFQKVFPADVPSVGSVRAINGRCLFNHLFQLFLISSNDNYTAAVRLAVQKGFTMSAVTQYRCEMCGTESSNPLHWFMIRCNANELKVLKWNFEEASLPGTRHYCGEAHAGVYVSRWLEDSCSPSRPDYNRPSAS
jgi:hypothetical protein